MIAAQAGQILSEAVLATDFTIPIHSSQTVFYFFSVVVLFYLKSGHGYLEKESSHCFLNHVIYKLSFFSIDSGRMTLSAHVPLAPGITSITAAIRLHHAYPLNPLDNKHFDVGNCVLFLSLSIPPLMPGVY